MLFTDTYDREGVDGLLKLFLVAVSETNVIVDVSFIRSKRPVLKGRLKGLDTFLVLFKCVVGEAQEVEDPRVVVVNLQGRVQVLDTIRVQLKVVVALGTTHQKFNVGLILIYSCVEET
jgi:hypothetical protein